MLDLSEHEGRVTQQRWAPSRLIRVEIRRLWARSATWNLSFAMVAILGFMILMLSASTPTPGDQAQLLNGHRDAVAMWEEHGEAMVAECEAFTPELRTVFAGVDFIDDCEQEAPRTEAEFLTELRSFTNTASADLAGMAIWILVTGLSIGASFVAAEFTTGSLSTWLTFEPRRLRVLLSKVSASLLAVVPLALVGSLVATLGIRLAYWRNDPDSVVPPDAWAGIGLLSLRIVLLTAVVAAIGATLAALTRHTAGAVGVVGVYFLVIESPSLFGVGETTSSWFLSTNIRAVIGNGVTTTDLLCRPNPQGGQLCVTVENTVSLAQGSLYLAVLTGLLILVTALVFNRRDIH